MSRNENVNRWGIELVVDADVEARCLELQNIIQSKVEIRRRQMEPQPKIDSKYYCLVVSELLR